MLRPVPVDLPGPGVAAVSAQPVPVLPRRVWHPATIAGCLAVLAALATATALRRPELGWLAWGGLGVTAGFATSGSV